MAGRPRIFFVGSYMHAFTIRTQRFPRDGETVLGTHAEIGPGGKGSNQAIAAARLAAEVEMLACVGDDPFGAEARQLWQGEGISSRWIRIDAERPTGMAFIVLDERGQNRIIVNPGANDHLTVGDVDAAEEAISRADVLVAQFESPVNVVERALALARRHSVRTILNPAPVREVPDGLLSLVDIITPNEAEIQALTGLDEPEFAAHALRGRGVESVILTLGESGAYVLDEAGARTVRGIRVPVLDTTGAGDAFTGTLAVTLARGADLDEAASLANLAGAFCVTRPGVVPGLGCEQDLVNMRASGQATTQTPASTV